MNHVLALAFAIGFVAGLRSMIAPAVVAWAAHLGWIDLQQSSFRWMGSMSVAVIFSLLAAAELLRDKRPYAPKRTNPFPLAVRMVMGGFCGLCLSAAAGQSSFAAAILGGIGGLVGAFIGYRTRTWLVRIFHAKDKIIAIAEDLITLGLAILLIP